MRMLPAIDDIPLRPGTDSSSTQSEEPDGIRELQESALRLLPFPLIMMVGWHDSDPWAIASSDGFAPNNQTLLDANMALVAID
jgi:hypothetical protein